METVYLIRSTQIQIQRSKGKPENIVEQIVKDLCEKNVFRHVANRQGHPSFPDFNFSLLSNLHYRDMHTWITGHLKEWSKII